MSIPDHDRPASGENSSIGDQNGQFPDSPRRKSARKRRKKSQPYPAYDDAYDPCQDYQKGSRGLQTMKDAGSQQLKQQWYERLGRSLILDCGTTSAEDVVVLHYTSNEQIAAMSAYQTLMQFFIKEAKMTDGKFRALVMQQGGNGVERKSWRPRIHKHQVHVIQDARYPRSEEEWRILRDVVVDAQGTFGVPRLLDEDVDVDEVMDALRGAVEKAREFVLEKPANDKGFGGGGGGGGFGGGGGYRVRPDGLKVPRDDGVNYQEERYFGNDLGDHAMNEVCDDADSVEECVDDAERPSNNLRLKHIELHVDSQTFRTTSATLMSVQGSFFYDMLSKYPTADTFFVDRTPKVFEYVLEYLREKRFDAQQEGRGDPVEGVQALPLPTDPTDLERLRREARYFRLPELVELVELQKSKQQL
jgi:hypothetical protein